MNIIFLCPSLKRTDGWSRYSHDVVLRLAKSENVIVLCHEKDDSIDIPQVEVLRSPTAYLPHPVWVLFDAFRVRRTVSRFLKKNEENYVHATAEGYAMFAPFLRGLGAKILMTIHGTHSVRPLLSWKTRWLYSWVYRAVDRVVSVSFYTKKHLLKHAPFLPEAKVFVVTNGVDFEERPLDTRVDDAVFRILCVGEVKHRKGAQHLVRAASFLQEKYDFPFHVTFVGRVQREKQFFRDLESYIAKNNLQEYITFAGMISQEELDAQYQNANVFALLSVHEGTDYEGYPLVFHEAAMWGLPTIGTFDCGAEDAIQDGRTGVLVHPEQHEVIADAIAKLQSGSLDIPPAVCVSWAKENDWDRKNLLDMYAL